MKAEHNIAPMSSIFWLAWRGILGLAGNSKTTENLRLARSCTINLPSVVQADAVDRLALTTGTEPVPERKTSRGYRHVADKFNIAGLTPRKAETIAAPRVLECPIQLEAVVEAVHEIAEGDERLKGGAMTFEVRVQRVHAEEDILVAGNPNRIDPDKWRPLIMSFQKFYGLGAQVHPSTLAEVPEAKYRSPDVDRARQLITAAKVNWPERPSVETQSTK
ncbi:flavin reductase family protein [Rhizobium oryzicola]|uniref:flavin reductase family protein n=1 Tax=Rhizobium oryzicola TaxID=1232668 RepID=UPI00345BBC8A